MVRTLQGLAIPGNTLHPKPMWPKLLLQLTEHLPKLIRLIPLLESLVASRLAAPSASAELDLTPLNEATEALKAELGQVARSHVALSKQIFEAHQDLNQRIEHLSTELRSHQEASSRRIDQLEHQLHNFQNWFWILLALLLVAIALMIALLVVK
ncbi:hypothetical protein [Terriglobus albidus]|uniref:hypothetical protein n=1 Tax=Terriglobus albidus TaxID=1592106 RepID=UPI0021DF5C80|nr:hypothetical protein [Terriglobus albidus]